MRRSGLSSEPKVQHQCREQDGDQPPERRNAMGHRLFATELPFCEFLVIEFIFREVGMRRVSSFGPTGFVICAAFRTNPGLGRNGSAAVNTNLQVRIPDSAFGIAISLRRWRIPRRS